jgi:signal transduction histidine kinase
MTRLRTWLNSIRGRIALVSAGMIALVLTIAGIGLVLLFESYIERRVAQELRGRVLDVAGAVTLNDKGEAAVTRVPSDPRYRNPYSGAYWYVREADTVLMRSRSLWDSDVVWPPDAQAMDSVVTAGGPDGGTVYLLEKAVTLGEGAAQRKLVLGAAVDQAEVQALSNALGYETAAALGVLGLVLFAGAWMQMRYGLQPLASVRQQLGELHMGKRETLAGPFPEEIEGLAHDLNKLFAHQKQMITRARERAGTLAHGFKTPMTILYGEARKLDLTGQTQVAGMMREQLDHIRQQVDRELSRARAHGASAGIGLQADVSATALRIVDLMQRMPRGSEIDWRVPEPGVHATMDSDDCGEVLGNLLDNARKWARTRVDVDARMLDNGHVRIAISDDGPGIPQQFREKALERGEAFSEQGDSSGLGLSIVSDLIAPYGSTVVIEQSKFGGACVSFVVKGAVTAA